MAASEPMEILISLSFELEEAASFDHSSSQFFSWSYGQKTWNGNWLSKDGPVNEGMSREPLFLHLEDLNIPDNVPASASR